MSNEDRPDGMRPEWAASAAGRVAKLAADIQHVIDRTMTIRRQADSLWAGPDKEAYAFWNDNSFMPALLDTQEETLKLSRVIDKNLDEQTAKSKASNFAVR